MEKCTATFLYWPNGQALKKLAKKWLSTGPRKYGITKFGWERFVNGFLDLLSITFVGKFCKKPMHFFGLWGTLFFLFGLLMALYLIVSKIIEQSFALTNKPWFLSRTNIYNYRDAIISRGIYF